MSDRDDTRPITCAKCGRSFVSPQWYGWQGPLCPACFERLHREEEVRLHHVRDSRKGVTRWLRGLFGR